MLAAPGSDTGATARLGKEGERERKADPSLEHTHTQVLGIALVKNGRPPSHNIILGQAGT